MKKCSSCGIEKAETEFQRRTQSPDFLTASCKACLKARDRARYIKERDKRAEWMKRYAKGKGKAITAAAKKRWVNKPENHVKRACHVIAGNAIRTGLLVKGPCEVCGSSLVHAHHDDYSKPLEVRWLCPVHHKEHHERHRP